MEALPNEADGPSARQAQQQPPPPPAPAASLPVAPAPVVLPPPSSNGWPLSLDDGEEVTAGEVAPPPPPPQQQRQAAAAAKQQQGTQQQQGQREKAQTVLIARPLPRVLLVHCGGTLGMDATESFELDLEGHTVLKPVRCQAGAGRCVQFVAEPALSCMMASLQHCPACAVEVGQWHSTACCRAPVASTTSRARARRSSPAACWATCSTLCLSSSHLPACI